MTVTPTKSGKYIIKELGTTIGTGTIGIVTKEGSYSANTPFTYTATKGNAGTSILIELY